MNDVAPAPDLVRRMKNALLDLLFPPRCVGCQRVGSWLCPRCLQEIELIKPPICPRCGQPKGRAGLCSLCRCTPPQIDAIRAVAYFQGTLRQAIHRFKYQNQQNLAIPLGQLLSGYLQEHNLPVEVIVPVPLHPTRVQERGYNQAALLARQLGQQTGLPVVENSLLRVKKTLPQVDLNAQERKENMQGAFRCADDRLVGRRVLLIDDVCTTGATLEASSVALREHKAHSVWALVLARGK